MQQPSLFLILLLTLLFITLPTKTLAHSKLVSPKSLGKGACSISRCSQSEHNKFCPSCSEDSKSVATYYRGEKVHIKWTRNNHDFAGGFVKFSLVRLDDKCIGWKHKKLSFYYTCWGQGSYDCRPHRCGTDSKGKGWSTDIWIPTVVPDGEYVLGWTWYGGSQYFAGIGKESRQWSDYYSCAHVEIKGGRKDSSWKVKFDSGGSKYGKEGGCLNVANGLGQCGKGKKCNRELRVSKPWEFTWGRKPRDLIPKDFGG